MARAKATKKDKEEDAAGEPPTSIDPYEVLDVPKDATDDQIKKAYRKAALRHHPDKAIGTDAATAHTDFQRIAFAYSILSTPARRAHYDRTGSTTESALDDDDFNWEDFFRARYEEITVSALDKFLASYRNSDEERADLLKAYTAGEGSMDRVFQSVMGSNELTDEERFRKIIDGAIKSGDVKAWDSYVNESEKSKQARRKRAEKEAKEAEKVAAKRDKSKASNSKRGSTKKGAEGLGDADLVALIQQRQADRGRGFVDGLEAKYAAEEAERKQAKKGARKRKQGSLNGDDDGNDQPGMDEPPEEAFKAMEERMQKAQAKKARK